MSSHLTPTRSPQSEQKLEGGTHTMHNTMAARRRARRTEHGYSLIEVLIALALISMVVLALAGGLLTLIKITGMTQKRQQMTLALGNSSESIKAMAYEKCLLADANSASASRYAAAYDGWDYRWEPRENMTVTIVAVDYWDRASESFVSDRSVACAPSDPGAQRLTVRVDYQGESRFGHVVKRDMT